MRAVGSRARVTPRHPFRGTGPRRPPILVLLLVAACANVPGAQAQREPGVQIAPLAPVNAEPFDDVLTREVQFMARVAELSPQEGGALKHEALKTRARWGGRIDNTAVSESLRRELTPLLKDISRVGWEKYDAERARLEARRRHAAILGQVAEYDEAIVLTDQQRTALHDYLATPSLVSFWQPQNPNPPLWPTKRLPAAISARELGGVEILEKRLATVLWPGQFVAYKQFKGLTYRTPVVDRAGPGIVTVSRRPSFDEQQRLLRIHLDRLIDTADTVCRLNDAQREKLSLAGKIDIEGWAERYHAIESVESEDPATKGAKLSALSETPHLMLCEPASNYQKALVARLTTEQVQKLAAAEGQRHAFYRRALVEAVVVGFERSASLTSEQCDELTQTLNEALTASNSVHPWRSTCLRMIVELPEQKLRPIFTLDQWPAIRRQLRQLDEISRRLEAEAAGKVAVFRNVRGEKQDGLENVELEFEAEERILDVN